MCLKIYPHGFRFLTGTATPPEAQLDLVRKAEIIVAPYGAGTAICAFAPEDCMIVETAPSLKSIYGIFNATISSLILGQPFARIAETRVVLADNPATFSHFWDYATDPKRMHDVLNAFFTRNKFELQ